MTALDRRLHAYRPDLADERLKGQVEAARFARPERAVVTAPVADLLRAPRLDAGLDTQLLAGQTVKVFDRLDGWAWGQADRDGYVGYVADANLGEMGDEPRHVVRAPRTFVYSGPDLKLPRIAVHSLGARVKVAGHVETRGARYAILPSGEAMAAAHLARADEPAADFVAVAETLIHTPYLWGGASGFGIDCSGLVQLSMRMAGKPVLRDTDMQASTIGEAIDPGDFSRLRRGDLVFWKGHVGIMTDETTLLHANGHTMTVSVEPLRQAMERIFYLYGGPTGVRRP